MIRIGRPNFPPDVEGSRSERFFFPGVGSRQPSGAAAGAPKPAPPPKPESVPKPAF
jgi:hypothetical protein